MVRGALVALNDPRLRPVLEAPEGRARDLAIEELVVRDADPFVKRIVARYRGLPYDPSEDCDDLVSTVHLRIIHQLRRAAVSREHAVRNFRDYLAALTFHTISDALRRRFPERAKLRNRLRYAIAEDRRLVTAAHSEGLVAAIGTWSPPFHPEGLLTDPANADANMLDSRDPGNALLALLQQVGHPLFLDAIVPFFAELWNIREAESSPPNDAMPDPARTILGLVEQRQQFARLLAEVRELPPAQRSALLLSIRDEDGGSVMAVMILAGIVSFDDLAAIIGITAEDLEAIWNDLPLDDLSIGMRLNRTRQQVINLRKSARARLTRRVN